MLSGRVIIMSYSKISIGDKVKHELCDIIYEVIEKKKQGGIMWYCLEATNKHWCIRSEIEKVTI